MRFLKEVMLHYTAPIQRFYKVSTVKAALHRCKRLVGCRGGTISNYGPISIFSKISFSISRIKININIVSEKQSISRPIFLPNTISRSIF